jgi:hypothetical protein
MMDDLERVLQEVVYQLHHDQIMSYWEYTVKGTTIIEIGRNNGSVHKRYFKDGVEQPEFK